jgi:D-alanine-D-alanine ligase
VPETRLEHLRQCLTKLDAALSARASDLALYLVYDRPSRVNERPALARTFFAQRCETDDELELIIGVFRDAGAYVELFEGEQPFMTALTSGRLRDTGRPLQVAYNGIGWGIGDGGFQAGRKALVPLVCDSYGVLCANSPAYACALTRHKFHCFTVLRALGITAPHSWQYRLRSGWAGDAPPEGAKVIVKSTHEAWAVGVTNESVFTVDASRDRRVRAIADAIGQDVTVQEFKAGPEVYVPILGCPEPQATPPVESILRAKPRDPEAFVTIHDNLGVDAVAYEPFEAPAQVMDRLDQTAIAVFDALELSGFARIDFRLDDAGTPWVFDVAVSPSLELGGSGELSLARLGFDHATFVRIVLACSLSSSGVLDA